MRPTARSMELRRARQALILQARAILDGAEASSRDLDAQERERYDLLDADIEQHTARIEREERQAERDAAAEERLNGGAVDPPAGGNPGQPTEEQRQRRFAALRTYLLRGNGGLNDAERRDLQADSDTAGGYTIPDMQFLNDLLQNVTDQTWIRQPGWARTFQVTSAESLGVPYLSARIGSCRRISARRPTRKGDSPWPHLVPHRVAKPQSSPSGVRRRPSERSRPACLCSPSRAGSGQ